MPCDPMGSAMQASSDIHASIRQPQWRGFTLHFGISSASTGPSGTPKHEPPPSDGPEMHKPNATHSHYLNA